MQKLRDCKCLDKEQDHHSLSTYYVFYSRGVQSPPMISVAGGVTSSGDGGGSMLCLLCEVLCVGKVFGFNHKIMINI
jgi:hypothetical protein